MFNYIIDFLYNIGLYKNELLDYVSKDEKTYQMFLNDVQLLEKGTVPFPKPIPKLVPVLQKNTLKDFEKTMDALVKVLENDRKNLKN